MKKNIKILKGNICYSKNKNYISTVPGGYLVSENGIIVGAFEELPEIYQKLPVDNYGDQIIIPGLVDLHVHAPQYAFRGLGMDLELLEWLEQNTFPEEGKYQDLAYARSAYTIFANELKASATTRTCVFATVHVKATLLLMELLEASGMCGFVGKVNMDRNAPDYLCEKNAEISLADTKEWLEHCAQFKRIKPMLTPRFIPTCTDALMEGLGAIQKEYQIPVQSHLSENLGEIEWVKELCPEAKFYGDAYERTGMFGGKAKTIMAHCVYSSEEEIDLMKANQVFIAHCAQSNTNLASGIAPIRRYLNRDMKVGLGTDVAGGSSISMFRAITDSIQVSKLRWRLVEPELKPLTVEETFYLATKGGGEFFGKVGSFEAGYELDAVILDDSILPHPQELTLKERLERMLYMDDKNCVVAKIVAGKQLF